MNLNKVFLVGRLTKDPEMKYTPSGHAITSFSLATNRYWTNDAGEKQEDTQYHNIKAWRRQGEIANEFLRKGMLCLIEGKIENSSWQDDAGSWKNFSAVVVDNIQLPPKSMGTTDVPNGAPAGEEPALPSEDPTDIPF